MPLAPSSSLAAAVLVAVLVAALVTILVAIGIVFALALAVGRILENTFVAYSVQNANVYFT